MKSVPTEERTPEITIALIQVVSLNLLVILDMQYKIYIIK